MAVKGSAAKRHRQSEKKRVRNKMVRSRIKTSTKQFLESIADKSQEDAERRYRELASLMDRAVTKGVFHRNMAARKKSRMHRLLSELK